MKWKTEYTVLSVMAGLVITIIVMAVVWSNSECPTYNTAPLEQKVIDANLKIKEYEKQILIKNATIDAYSNIQLDSVWSRIHTNNPR